MKRMFKLSLFIILYLKWALSSEINNTNTNSDLKENCFYEYQKGKYLDFTEYQKLNKEKSKIFYFNKSSKFKRWGFYL